MLLLFCRSLVVVTLLCVLEQGAALPAHRSKLMQQQQRHAESDTHHPVMRDEHAKVKVLVRDAAAKVKKEAEKSKRWCDGIFCKREEPATMVRRFLEGLMAKGDEAKRHLDEEKSANVAKRMIDNAKVVAKEEVKKRASTKQNLAAIAKRLVKDTKVAHKRDANKESMVAKRLMVANMAQKAAKEAVKRNNKRLAKDSKVALKRELMKKSVQEKKPYSIAKRLMKNIAKRQVAAVKH